MARKVALLVTTDDGSDTPFGPSPCTITLTQRSIMADTFKVEYKEVEIVYSEENSRFEFELRGKERYSESLAKAKETIDKPVAGLGGKKFEPVRALFNSSWGVLPGTITSIAAKNGYGRSNEVWFVQDENKCRSKELLSDMYEESESNLRLCEESKALEKEANSLRRKAEVRRNSMTRIKITIPE